MPEMRIANAETLRAISDPTRMRILETMVQRQDPAWSVKELAAALGVPQTRLYHHVEHLLASTTSSGDRAARRVRDHRDPVQRRRALVPARPAAVRGRPRGGRVLHETLLAVFDTARDEIELAIRLGADRSDARTRVGPLLSRGLTRLTPAAPSSSGRLQALTEEFGATPALPSRPRARRSGSSSAVYPMPPPRPRPRSPPMTDVPAAPSIGVRDLLRIPDFRRLYLAQAISDLGDGMTYLALFLLVLDLTGSTAAIALMSILVALPPVTIGLFAGAYADRHDRRRIMLVSDTLRAVVVVSMVLVGRADALPALFALACSRPSSARSSRPPASRWCRASSRGRPARRELAEPGDAHDRGRHRRRDHRRHRRGPRARSGRCSSSMRRRSSSRWCSSSASAREAGLPSRGRRRERQGAAASGRRSSTACGVIARSAPLIAALAGISVTMLGVGAINVLFIPFLVDDLGASPAWAGPLEAAQTIAMIVSGAMRGDAREPLQRPAAVRRRHRRPRGLRGAPGGGPGPLALLVVMFGVGAFTMPVQATTMTIVQSHDDRRHQGTRRRRPERRDPDGLDRVDGRRRASSPTWSASGRSSPSAGRSPSPPRCSPGRCSAGHGPARRSAPPWSRPRTQARRLPRPDPATGIETAPVG